MMTRGRGGVWLSPENDDVIYEQPLTLYPRNKRDNEIMEIKKLVKESTYMRTRILLTVAACLN